MKKNVIAVLLILSALSANAQVYLTDAYKPEESQKYTAISSKGSERMSIAIFQYKGGFTLGVGGGGLIADNKDGYAVFKLGGAYDKISFVVGPGSKATYADYFTVSGNPNSAGNDRKTIFTVKADGRILADDVIWCYDAPKEYVLNLNGADELRISTFRGEEPLAFGNVRLWKSGQSVVPSKDPQKLPAGKVTLTKQLTPYFIRHSGWVDMVTPNEDWPLSHVTPSVSINRYEYTSGLTFTATQEFLGNSTAWAYFWLQKKYDTVSFIIGPRDNQSSNASGWLTVKGDGKILYERQVYQDELAEQVVLDVRGVNQLSFESIDQSSDFLGGLVFGVVDIMAYTASDKDIPVAGIVNPNKGKYSTFPDAIPLASKIKPFSVRGVGSYNNTYFSGESTHYTFSMGGENFYEGFVLTTGNTLFDDNISSYVEFDLAGEFDWTTFTVGTLTKHRVMDEDRLLVYADDNLILDVDVHCTWPNQVFTLPLGKCRTLRFAKPGTGKSKQTYIGVGDVMVFRGEPVDTAPYFYHRYPDCPETVDLIDLCGNPYFHYVGRYLSNITNFDFNDCFKNGTSQKEYFQMKDGSRIYKGIMLETNIPPAFTFENISLSEAVFICMMGAGSAISSSNVAAATGVSAGAGLAGALAAGWQVLDLVGDSNHQSAAAAFNPFGEYETLTFTVDNKSEYVDTDAFGAKMDPNNPVKLYVFADMRRVGEFWLTNTMSPSTFTVPINKCTQLMFWLQCGESRSGQYVLYDMTLSKTPVAPVVAQEEPSGDKSADEPKSKKKKKKKQAKKEEERVVWDLESYSRNEAIDVFLNDVTAVWDQTQALMSQTAPAYTIHEDWVLGPDGLAYKCVSFLDGRGNRRTLTDIKAEINALKDASTSLQAKAGLAMVGIPSATLGIANLPFDKMPYFSKYVKKGGKVLTQCTNDVKNLVETKELELENIQSLEGMAVSVGKYKSTDSVLIFPKAPGEVQPAAMQRLEYYRF